MKSKTGNIVGLLVIVCLGILFHIKYINEFPSHTHAWAQSDRYALAQGFVNNNLNFFKPETFVFNHQFPDNWKVPSDKSVTSVDFPLHDYIPAVFMRITGSTAPWLFRLYILLYSFIGLYFLFRLALLLSKSLVKSVLIVVFAATSPVFVFYQGGFLPTIPSLANAFIAIFFYAKYVFTGRKKFFSLAIIFLTLAALSRTTFAIPLLAVIGYEFLRIIRKRTSLQSSIPLAIPVFFSASAILGYYFYNAYLRANYGSIFLNEVMPAENVRQFIDILKIVKDSWLYQYFSVFHYALFILLSGVLLYAVFFRKKKIESGKKELFLLSGIILIGYIAFFMIMTRQFSAHDYYFLDTFYLPFILLLVLLVSAIPEEFLKSNSRLFLVVALVISGLMIYKAFDFQTGRHKDASWNRTTSTVNNFKDSEAFLDSIGVSKDAKMLVIDPHAPNIPFLQMNRKGYAVMSTTMENIEDALSWDFDYIVMQNEFFLSDVYTPYPEIISRTKKMGDNGLISVSILIEEPDTITLNEYLGLEGKEPVLEEFISFETLFSEHWSNTSTVDNYSYTGNNAGKLSADMSFGLTYKSKDMAVLKEKSRILHFQAYFYGDSLSRLDLVVSLNEDGESIYYKSYDLSKILIMKEQWEKIDLLFQLPPVKSEDYEFAMYLWNRGKSELMYDDFGFRMY